MPRSIVCATGGRGPGVAVGILELQEHRPRFPAASVSGAVANSIWLAAAGITCTAGLVPVIVPSAESVAVIVWLPAVVQDDVGEGVRSGVGGGESIAGRQAVDLAVGADEVHRAQVLVGVAALEVAVRVVGRDGDRARGAGDVRVAKLVVTVKWSAAAGSIGIVAPPELPVVSVPLVAVSVIDPLVVSNRSSNVATPATAVWVSVPPRLPAEPLASADRHGAVEGGSMLPYGSSAPTPIVNRLPAGMPPGGRLTIASDTA